MEKSASKKWATALVALVVGLVVGWAVTMAADNNDSDTDSMSMSKPTSATKAADLRADLVSLGGQHVQLADIALDAAMDGSPYAGAAKDALVQNGVELSNAIGSVYGDEAGQKFNKLWNRHLNDFVNYAVSAKKGDDAGKQAAVKDLNDYSSDVGDFLSGANPNLPKETVVKAFKIHLNQLTDMIDAHVAGNYKQEFKSREDAVNHLKGVDSTLASAIVKQFPDNFKQ